MKRWGKTLLSGALAAAMSLLYRLDVSAEDLTLAENAVDLVEDEQCQPKTYPNALGVYMPDGISLFEVEGVTYLVTANEGDSREWGEEGSEYANEKKVTLTASDETQAEKVRALDKEFTTVLQEGKEYLFGTRSFAIYNAETMEQVYESGNEFEARTAEYLPQWFNCSNDDLTMDNRSAKKGPEPESVVVGTVGDKVLAFVALERIGGLMVYDVTSPAKAEYVNYINTRDFSGEIAGDTAPEGLSFLNLDGKPMVLAACEVSGTVAAYAVEEGSSTPAAQQVMGQEPAGSAPSDALNGEETPPESAQQNQDVSNPSPVIGLVLVAVLAAVLCGLAVYKAKKSKEK